MASQEGEQWVRGGDRPETQRNACAPGARRLMGTSTESACHEPMEGSRSRPSWAAERRFSPAGGDGSTIPINRKETGSIEPKVGSGHLAGADRSDHSPSRCTTP